MAEGVHNSLPLQLHINLSDLRFKIAPSSLGLPANTLHVYIKILAAYV